MKKKDFLESLSRFATGITIITLGNISKGFFGCTVNSFTSVSLVPSKILFCIDNKNSFLNKFKKNTYLNISILSDKQKKLSNKFSSNPKIRWKSTSYILSNKEIPYFKESLVTLECILEKKINSGDHKIIICNFKKVINKNKGNPLIYFDRSYIS